MLKLIEELQATSRSLDSIVQTQLMKEDIARLERVRELAQDSEDYEKFEKESLYLDWTQGDFRTPELHATLKPFLIAAFKAVNAGHEDSDAQLRQSWIAFSRERAEKLVGCL